MAPTVGHRAIVVMMLSVVLVAGACAGDDSPSGTDATSDAEAPEETPLDPALVQRCAHRGGGRST
jgi:hypothetical protein